MMANASRLQASGGAEGDAGLPPLSLGLSQPADLRQSSLAPPAAAVSLGLSVPSLPQSYASDELVLDKPTSPPPQQLQRTAAAAPHSAPHTVSTNTVRQPSQPAAAEQTEDAQPAEDSDEEPAWETVHADDVAALDGADAEDGEYGREKIGSSTVEDSLGAMALSLFDDGTQLPDDYDSTSHAPRPASAHSQHHLMSSLPAFPSLPSGLRTPPPVIPATPSPPLERLSPATGTGRPAAVAGLLSPRSPDVVLSSIVPSPPPSPQPALPATEPVSSSSSASSSASSLSPPAASLPPTSPPDLARRPSTYSQETNPILSLHSTPSSPSPAPSLAPQAYSQHPSMPALEQATGDQPDVDVDELLRSGERQSVEAVRDEDGFVRPAVPRRQSTQERRNGSQRVSQPISSPHSPLRQRNSHPILSPPHSPLRSSPHSPQSPAQSPPRPAPRSPYSSSSSSSLAAATAAPLAPPPRAASTDRPMQRSSSLLLTSQLQSQVESQAWDLAYHYPELDAVTRDQLIADRGLTALYNHNGSAPTAANRQESDVDAGEDDEPADEVKAAGADEPAVVQPQQELQQSLEFDLSDYEASENDATERSQAAQPAEQSAHSYPIAEGNSSDYEASENDATERSQAAQPAEQSAHSYPIPEGNSSDYEASENDATERSQAEQPAEQSAHSYPIAEGTFCSQDSDSIPQFTISAQQSLTASNGGSTPPPKQHARSDPPAPVLSPEFTLSSSPSESPLSPPHAATPTKQVADSGTNHIASRTRSREMQQQPEAALPSPALQHAAARHPSPERSRPVEECEQAEAQHGSSGLALERQLSIDPEHPGSDTVLQQRQLMRDIRKHQRQEERLKSGPAAAATLPAAHNKSTQPSKQPSSDRQHGRRTRALTRQDAVVGEAQRSSGEEEAEEDDDDFVPLSSRMRPYSATREQNKTASKTASKTAGRGADLSKARGRRIAGSEQKKVVRSNNVKRKVALDDDIEEAQDESHDDDKQNGQPREKQWKRLHKPSKGDSSGGQPATSSAKKAKASERANKLRQSSLLEHYSSTPSLTPPIAVEEPLDFSPDPTAAALPPPVLSTPAYSRRAVASKPTVATTPTTAPALFASTTTSRHLPTSSSPTAALSASLTSPARAAAAAVTVSVASRRGLVDITNTVNSRQRPPASSPAIAKQPSNGWRTKRRKGDDGTEWEESPPSKRVDAVRPQREQQQRSGSGGGLRRSAANVGSLGRRESRVEREVVVLDATQDPNG